MVTADQAAKLGAWGVIASMQPNFDALWGGADGMYARRLGAERGSRLNPLALLASQGVPLALGSDAPVTGLDPWATVRAAVNHQTPGSAVSARAAFAAATRGGWRAGGVRDGTDGHPGARRAGLLRRVGRRDPRRPRAARRRPALVHRSAFPGARVAAVGPGRRLAAMPADRASRRCDPWLRHRAGSTAASRRATTRPTALPERSGDVDPVDDEAEIATAIEDADVARRRQSTGWRSCTTTRARRQPRRWQRLRGWPHGPLAWLSRAADRGARSPDALRPRSDAAGAAVAAGLLLCASFPPFNWWWAAVVALALLAWVLTRPATTPVGGFGLRLPVRPGVLPAADAAGSASWSAPCPGWRWRLMCALFPGLFGLGAVVVRRLPGWPIWFAVLWAAQEWLKSIVPVRRLPLGRGGLRSDRRARFCRWSGWAASRCSRWRSCWWVSAPTAIAMEIVKWWNRHPASRGARGADARGRRPPPPAVVLPGALHLPGVVRRRHRLAAGAARRHRIGQRTRRSPSRRCRATCRGSASSSTRNVERCWTTTSGRPCGWPTTCVPGRAPQPHFVDLARGLVGHRPAASTPTPAQQIAVAVAAIGAPILVGTVLDVAGRPASTGPIHQHGDRVEPGHRTRRPPRQGDRAAIRRIPAVPWLLPASVRATPTGPATSSPAKAAGWCTSPGCRSGSRPAGKSSSTARLRNAVRNGAQLLAVPANNATFNKTMSEQQLAFAKVRAVEHDRYVVVAGNVGISAVIAPDGARAGTDRLLPARLPGHPGAPQDEADAGHPLGPDRAVGPGRGGRSGHSGRDTAQWMVPRRSSEAGPSALNRKTPPSPGADDEGRRTRRRDDVAADEPA